MDMEQSTGINNMAYINDNPLEAQLADNSVAASQISAELVTGYKGVYNRLVKRALDVVLAVVLLVCLLPLYLLIAVAIVVDDGFPIAYRAKRGGYKERTFYICKFRSMVSNADKIGGGTTAQNDKRITRVGRVIRKLKLDEILNIINILKGEEAYKFLDKLLKADIEQNKIQERMRNGEKLDEAYYYKTKFVLSYKFHTSENLNIYIGEYEFGGKEKVSEAIEHRAKTYSAQIIPKDELQNFKKEEERYLEYLQGKQVNMKNEKYILAVPYAEREKAKALGAEWDKDGRFWYCLESEKEKFFKWDIKNVENKVKSDIPLNIEEEFLNRIKSAGVLENTVIADGQKHRISVDGDKGKEQSGFYVLHSDGVANGYFMNNRTGEEIKWNSKENSYNSMTPEEKAEMKALYQARKAEREQEDKILTEKAEKALYAKFMNKETINEHSYLTNKMIEPTQNIYVGNDNTITVPLYNVDGRLKSAQYIDADGNKRFAKNTNKVGAFHIVDGNAADLKSATSIIIAEGYATAASINEAVKEPGLKVIAAMSANNLEHTVKAITEKYPAINIVIAADNDLENKVGNIGLNAAKNVSEKYKNVTVAIPKMNGKEVAGDFNDIVSKKGLSKEDGLKAIHSSIKSYIKQQDIVQNKVPDKDLKIEQKSVIER